MGRARFDSFVQGTEEKDRDAIIRRNAILDDESLILIMAVLYRRPAAMSTAPKDAYFMAGRGETAISRRAAGQAVGTSQTKQDRGNKHTPEHKHNGDTETLKGRPGLHS